MNFRKSKTSEKKMPRKTHAQMYVHRIRKGAASKLRRNYDTRHRRIIHELVVGLLDATKNPSIVRKLPSLLPKAYVASKYRYGLKSKTMRLHHAGIASSEGLSTRRLRLRSRRFINRSVANKRAKKAARTGPLSQEI